VLAFPLSAGSALVMGVIFASFFENVYILKIKANTHRLLSVAIIGLGASVNIQSIIQVGLSGVGYTFIGITFTLLLGLLLGKLLKLNKAQTLLISSGTAICGGSAIAAVSSTLQAKNEDTAVALAVVFVLNAVSLWVFPYLGHYFGLSQEQFGLWSALAIHDTSSVVGAGMQYGERALEIATTVKLARALWIIPLTIVISYFFTSSKTSLKQKKFPWFILGFVLASLIVSYFPDLLPMGVKVSNVAKKLFVVTLFLIGSTINLKQIKALGPKPLYLGVLLWIAVATTTLYILML
jgi:uncharacterized integral membrane protein (TIGR00698 family)